MASRPQPPANYTPLPDDRRFYYAHGFSAVSRYREVYSKIRDAIGTRKTTLDLTDYIINTDELKILTRCVADDYPEYVWFTGEYKYKYISGNSLTVTSVTFDYLPAIGGGFNAEIVALRSVLDEFKKGLRSGMSAYELEMAAHDFVCKKATYDFAEAEAATSPATTGYMNPYAYSAYGALVKGKAVCEGYSRALAYLLTNVGVETYLVRGYDDGGHMWNLVKLETGWYHVDTTWNDIAEPNSSLPPAAHWIFNMTDAQIYEMGRDVFEVYDNISLINTDNDYNFHKKPSSSALKNYYIKEDLYLNSSIKNEDILTLKQIINTAKANGKKYIEFYAGPFSYFSNICSSETRQNEVAALIYDILPNCKDLSCLPFKDEASGKIIFFWQ